MHRIACMIGGMKDLEPPRNLLPSVMNGVRSKTRPWWYRAYRWAGSPRSITFTPLRLAPAAAILLVVCATAALYLSGGGDVRFTDAPSLDRIPVVLTLNMPQARSVSVIGSFNDWRPQSFEMRPSNGQRVWTLTLWLPAGRYEYSFLVNEGEIVPDPRAGFYQDDGFGNQNAVLIVGNNDENSI